MNRPKLPLRLSTSDALHHHLRAWNEAATAHGLEVDGLRFVRPERPQAELLDADGIRVLVEYGTPGPVVLALVSLKRPSATTIIATLRTAADAIEALADQETAA